MRSHPDWPLASLRRHAEELASAESAKPERAAAYFTEFPPTTAGGEIALADLLRADPARSSEAERLARETWREADFSPAQEKRLLKNFGSTLTAADHIYRADRLMLREQTAAAGRAAALGRQGCARPVPRPIRSRQWRRLGQGRRPRSRRAKRRSGAALLAHS